MSSVLKVFPVKREGDQVVINMPAREVRIARADVLARLAAFPTLVILTVSSDIKLDLDEATELGDAIIAAAVIR